MIYPLKNKIRVWCKTTKHFTDSPFLSSNGQHLLWLHTANEISLSRVDGLDAEDKTSDYIIHRYCELNDNLGVEIYEDDIVNVEVWGDWRDDKPDVVTYLVKWSFLESGWRGFTKAMIESGGTNRYSGQLLGTERTVIGNFLQNPNLFQ